MFHSSRFSSKQGFTTVELMVSVAIFLVITGFSLASYPAFSNRVSLDLLAHDLALTIREAQVYGLGVRRSGQSFPTYGVHFDLQNPKTFLLFVDTSEPINGRYDGEAELVQKYTITGKEEVKFVCAGTGGQSYAELSASDRVTYCGNDALDITFTRPRPDAKICVTPPGEASCVIAADAGVVVQAASGDTRTGVTYTSGQITVK